ncbi:MAG TPA: peptidylprolyl isomerase [Polyangiaceae bacterium]|nr:peptidylprolyl isomerase [Polyangiaceae bacterium]
MRRHGAHRLFGLFAAILACAACGEAPATATLGGDVVARVGGTISIPASLVGRTAAESHLSRDEALERLVGDAVGAREAAETGVDERPAVRVRVRAAVARSLVDRMQAEAVAAGPPTDAEVATLTKEAWLELDHPELRVAVHAVALVGEGKSSVEARRLAERILAAVASAKSPDDFLALADGPKTPGLEVRVEVLPPVAADGRTRGGGTLDGRFVNALFALAKVGDQSGITESPFGYHVMRLVERNPAYTMPLSERLPLFTPEVLSRRAKVRLDAALAESQKAREVVISPAAQSLIESFTFAAPPSPGAPPSPSAPR